MLALERLVRMKASVVLISRKTLKDKKAVSALLANGYMLQVKR